MEKKYEPTPEILAKAGELKARAKDYEVQELSVDDLDNVSGGCDYVDGVAYVYVNDPDWGTMSVDDYYDLVKWAYDSFGPDVGLGFALNIDPSAFNEEALRTGGPEYMRDTLKSRIIHFFTGDNFNPHSIWGTWS